MIRLLCNKLRVWALACLFFVIGIQVFADDKVYPDRPVPAVLVNDFAHILNGADAAQLERKLDDFAINTSTQICIVTIKNLGGHDVEEYSVEVFNRWGIGQANNKNGVLLLVSLDDRKAWITVGKGLEGVLTDAKAGLIFRNELRPAFKEGNYFQGLSDASDAIMAVTRGEYTATGLQKHHSISLTGILVLIVVIIVIVSMFGGGRGGGDYFSGRGFGGFLTGMLIGDLLGGGRRGGGGWSGGSGGGFGGFGGGSTGGGGAGGSW